MQGLALCARQLEKDTLRTCKNRENVVRNPQDTTAELHHYQYSADRSCLHPAAAPCVHLDSFEASVSDGVSFRPRTPRYVFRRELKGNARVGVIG